MEKLKIMMLSDIEKPEKVEGGDYIDLRAAEDTHMVHGEYKIIPLGVAMQLPRGYEAQVIPRSSTFAKYGIILANSVGLIDESYCGEDDQWGFPAICLCEYSPCTEVHRDEEPCKRILIPKGARIAQFRIMYHMQNLDIEYVDHLDGKSRCGFGSTGVM